MSNAGKVMVEDLIQQLPQSSQMSLISTELPPKIYPTTRAAVFTHIDSPARFYVHLQEGHSALHK